MPVDLGTGILLAAILLGGIIYVAAELHKDPASIDEEERERVKKGEPPAE